MANALIKVGRYQIVSELGRGSMGVVYQGFDPVIGRTIAIKTMLTEGLSPAEFQEFKSRFHREAQSAGVLAHPNIVTVYDFGEDGGVLYLAMEYLDGKSLQHIVDEQGILPVETIIPMYEQVCSALDHAHRNKIVHRDIKPANIMILESGQVKVTDFGIAKMMSMGMTQAGQILGTPNYMSPEQVKGRNVDGRADIFSLGVILYELATGEKPFGGQNITTVIYKIINENPIPPRELDATIHPGLSYVMCKALAKNADERYQTCRELADDLRNYKNLDGASTAGETVIIKVPQFRRTSSMPASQQASTSEPTAGQEAPLPAAAETPADRELRRPPFVQIIPPATSTPQKAGRPVVGVLVAILALGALGGGYYHFFVNKEVTPAPRGERKSTDVTPPNGTDTSQGSTGSTGAATSTTSATTTAPGQETSASATGTTGIQPLSNTPGGTSGQQQPQQPGTETVTTGHETTQKKPKTETESNKPVVPKVGELVVTANVKGAKIILDGRSQPGWVTPHTFSDLPTGAHLVVISKDGYLDDQESVTVQGGRSITLGTQLSVPTGEFSIVTKPPGLEVLIDGKSYGPSPVQATLSVGEHTYTINRPGMEPYEKTFVMKNGVMLSKTIDLGSGSASTGIVELRTIPPGATVYADDAPIGSQTPTSFRLTAGHHILKISLPGYRPIRQDVDVPAGGSIPVNATLPRQ